jgi:septal ring factor EnvC (AmiA/AmiB activator)
MDVFSDDRLSEIERKIDSLINAYRQAKEEQSRLLTKTMELEEENRQLRDRLQEMKNEREILLSKVKVILEKIDTIEV